jgi:hypothetical protein
MSQSEQSGTQDLVTSRASPSTTGRESSKTKADEWSDVTDPNERRKIQNKLAQRRFRKFIVRAGVC